jgi:endoglucanase
MMVGNIGSAPAVAGEEALRFTGINIAGADFGRRKIPGRAGTDYFYPSTATIDYFADKGMNIIRLPFLWERLQPVLGGDLDPDEFKRIDAVVAHATSRGVSVVLNVENFGAYMPRPAVDGDTPAGPALHRPLGSQEVPVSSLADVWRRLAERYKDNAQVSFGLMNEPQSLPTQTWLEAANAAIAAIRLTGARNLILVSGNGYAGAHNWFGGNYGTPNAEVMLSVVDPADNFAYEVHQYLDSDYSGTHPQCQHERVGAAMLQRFTQWLREHGKRGFLGEFGGGSDAVCLAAVDTMLAFMSEHRDSWLGWTYWAAGPWPRDYFTSLQPIDGADRAQMSVLLKHVSPFDAQSPTSK